MFEKHFSKNSSLYLYTDYLIADDAELHAGEMVRKHGGSRVLIVSSIRTKASELMTSIENSLIDAGLVSMEMPEGVTPNAPRTIVESGIEFARKNSIDFVLGIGGGSVIDTAKAIAIGLVYDGPVWDIFTRKVVPAGNAPVGSIPTIAAAGSESSRACVILDDIDTGMKVGCGFPSNRPVFCLLDPRLTFSVSRLQTACGACDAFGHTFNRFFFRDYCGLADEFAIGQMKNVVKYAPVAINEPDNYEARRELLLCATFGHNDITELGRGGAHGGAHDLFGFLTIQYGAPHGLAVAMGFAPWLEWLVRTGEQEAIERAAKFANAVFGVPADPEDCVSTALRGAQCVRDFVHGVGLPVTIGEFFAMHVADAGGNVIADASTLDLNEALRYAGFENDGYVAGYSRMSQEDVRSILEASR